MKNKRFDKLKNMKLEILDIEDDLVHQKNITGIKSFFYKWKLNDILEFLNKEEEIINNHKSKNLFNILSTILIIFLIILNLNIKSIFLLVSILILVVLKIIFFKKSRLINSMYEFILELHQLVLKTQNILFDAKIRFAKSEECLSDEVVMQIFDEANSDIYKKEYTNNVNFKDKLYRDFIIDLYNLKINEKELNQIYKKAFKVLSQN